MLRNEKDRSKKTVSVSSIAYILGIAMLLVFGWIVVNTVMTPADSVALANGGELDIVEFDTMGLRDVNFAQTGETGGGDDSDAFSCLEPNPEVAGSTGTTFRVLTDAEIFFGPSLESGTGVFLPAGDTFYILNNPGAADGWILWSYHGCAGSRWLAPGTPVQVDG